MLASYHDSMTVAGSTGSNKQYITRVFRLYSGHLLADSKIWQISSTKNGMTYSLLALILAPRGGLEPPYRSRRTTFD